jgi:hypothetical protein
MFPSSKFPVSKFATNGDLLLFPIIYYSIPHRERSAEFQKNDKMEKESIAKSHWDKFTNTLAQLQLSLDKYGGQTSADEVTALKESLIDLQNTLTGIRLFFQ